MNKRSEFATGRRGRRREPSGTHTRSGSARRTYRGHSQTVGLNAFPRCGERGYVLMILAVVMLMGCGKERLTVPVRGKVTLDGLPPPGPGIIYFAPVESAEGLPVRPATGEFDASGQYSAQTFVAGDGLIPGHYLVAIHCWKNAPSLDGPPAKSHIPEKYCASGTSGLELQVDPVPTDQPFDLALKSR